MEISFENVDGGNSDSDLLRFTVRTFFIAGRSFVTADR